VEKMKADGREEIEIRKMNEVGPLHMPVFIHRNF
jgi:hypothetical protein